MNKPAVLKISFYLTVVFLLTLITLVSLRHLSPYYLQYSAMPSIKTGWFYMYPCSESDIVKGDIVSFSVTKPDWYPVELWPKFKSFLKIVAGLEGDKVTFKSTYTSICEKAGDCSNYERIKGVPFNSSITPVIPGGMFMGVGTHPLSVDSRYLGYFSFESLESCASPVF